MARKRGQLVTQYLEKVSSRMLDEYKGVLRKHLRGRHGVYALYKGERLYYVGLAKSMRGRLNHHLKDRHAGKWDRFSVYLTIDNHHIRELESLVLRIAQPRGNRVKGKLHHSQSLEKIIRRKFREEQEAEFQELFGKKANRKTRTANRPRGRMGTLHPFIDGPMRIRMFHKGRVYKARVLKSGYISFRKHHYRGPSGAAVAIVKRPIDGWHSWKYERGPGDWVKLHLLR